MCIMPLKPLGYEYAKPCAHIHVHMYNYVDLVYALPNHFHMM